MMKICNRRQAIGLLAVAAAPLATSAPALAQSMGRITVPGDEIKSGVKGLKNLYPVDSRVYRAHKPGTPEAFAVLARRYGVRTIVDLRNNFDEGETGPAPPVRVVHAPIETFNVGGSVDEVARALAAIHQGRARGKVLVHCDYGRDRTGAVVALYHMMFHRWSRDRALTDMIAGPFGFHEFLTLFPPGRSIHGFVASVDVEAMRKRVLAMGPV